MEDKLFKIQNLNFQLELKVRHDNVQASILMAQFNCREVVLHCLYS